MPNSISHWQIGEVAVTQIVENESFEFPPEMMFNNLTQARVVQIPWLRPYYADSDGMLRLSVHAFVVESAGRRIIVDTCVGNDKERVAPEAHHLTTPFLDRLVAAGFPPESIDYVVCTHMHLDHVGWNTRWDGSQWIPTFPNARYLFGRCEWEHFQADESDMGDAPPELKEMLEPQAVIADSVSPVIDRGLADFVEADHCITAEVSLVPTPGHTPGHVSVLICSAGKKAVITGDVMHHPVQFSDPAIGAKPDYDRKLAEATRRALIEENVDQDVLLLGTHFVAPSGGRVVRAEAGYRFVPYGDGHALR